MSRIFQTKRLYYRPPAESDSRAIFDGFASDRDVTRYVGWPRHTEMTDTQDYLQRAQKQWEEWGMGPVLLECRQTGALIGTSGLEHLDMRTATTGYLVAKRYWGMGYATEALRAMLDLAMAQDLKRVFAYCHWDHKASRRVLEKCGFALVNRLEKHLVFPNLDDCAQDVCEYEVDWQLIRCEN